MSNSSRVFFFLKTHTLYLTFCCCNKFGQTCCSTGSDQYYNWCKLVFMSISVFLWITINHVHKEVLHKPKHYQICHGLQKGVLFMKPASSAQDCSIYNVLLFWERTSQCSFINVDPLTLILSQNVPYSSSSTQLACEPTPTSCFLLIIKDKNQNTGEISLRSTKHEKSHSINLSMFQVINNFKFKWQLTGISWVRDT